MFLLSTCNENAYFQTILRRATLCKTSKAGYVSLSSVHVHLLYSATSCNWTDKISYSTVSRLNFCTKNVWGNFFGGAYFCGSLEKLQKLERIIFWQLLAPRFLEYVSYVTSMLAVSAVTLLRTRLILIYFVVEPFQIISQKTVVGCPCCVFTRAII